MNCKKIIEYLSNPKYRFIIDANILHKYDSMEDREYLLRMYEAQQGKKLNLDKPQTFNEKMQWLKLYDRRSEYTTMVDKHMAKKYVADKIGEKYVIPTIGVWDDSEQIDFDKLPHQFVMKCNHNSGLGMYICCDKQQLDAEKVRKKLKKGLRQDFYLMGREWPYKDVPRKIIAEEYLADECGQLIDYKVHNFNGEPKFVLVCKDRYKESGLTEDFYTTDWKRMDVKRPNVNCSETSVLRPEKLDEILELSRVLSRGIPFLRTDFYIVNGNVYFSELTFFPASGFKKFEPGEWDRIFGEWLELPGKT